MNLALYCTVPEAAAAAGVTQAYVRLLLARKQLRGQKMGHVWLVLREDVARFVRIGRGPASKPRKPAKRKPKPRKRPRK
jgi:excisionase family DNA binding protein